ncbi:MAG: NAD(P)-dependent oxidoreductase [Bacteroidota bacterium]
MSKRKIFITGASGFIGRNLCEHFEKKYNLFSPTHDELDLLDTAKVENYIKDNNIEIIIHCANRGGGRDTLNLNKVLETNLRIFFNIVRCSNCVNKIITFGSGAEYDKRNPIVRIKEEDFDGSVPGDEYGFYKYVCSKYICNSSKIVCLRLFGVYGKYENYLFKFISNAIVKNIYKLPIEIVQNVYFDYLYADDLVTIVDYFINRSTEHNIYNIGTGQKIDLLSISKIINKISRHKSEIIIRNKNLNKEYTTDNSRLKNELPNFKFTSIEKGIRLLYQWYLENISSLDKDKIIKDPYINLIKI